MKTKAQLEWTDYMKAQLLHMQPTGAARIVGYGLLAFAGFAFLVVLFLFISQQFPLELFLLILFIIALALFYRYGLLPWRVRRIFRQQRELSMPYEVEVTEAGLNVSNELGNALRPWQDFTKWKENQELLLLYHSDMMFTILPRRFFEEMGEMEAIKKHLVDHHIPEAHNLRLAIGCLIYIALVILMGWILYMAYRSGAM
jgi:hypothetical protein